MSNDVLSGFEIRMIVDNDPVRIGHIAKNKEVTSQSGIRFHENEHIYKLVVDYDDRALRGIRIFTDQQLIALGPSYESDFYVECDKSENDNAIIGFLLVFSEDRIVELSAFLAPVTKRSENFSRPRESTFDKLNSKLLNYSKSPKKAKNDNDNLKSTFKLYKKLKKNNSF